MHSIAHFLFYIKKIFYLFIPLCITLISSGCYFDIQEDKYKSTLEGKWLYEDVVWLDAIDSQYQRADIIAVYFRQDTESNINEIRLDFLDSRYFTDFDLFIELDAVIPVDAENSDSYDYLITVSADSPPQIINSSGEILAVSPNIIHDAQNDAMAIQFSDEITRIQPDIYQMQVVLQSTENQDVLDSTPPINIHQLDRPERAPLLLTFWDVMPANTPAQAFRRWNGAHTGPKGDRHGLFFILQAMKETGLPVTLLDLKTPGSLSALDYLGAIDDISSLQNKGQLLLPDSAMGDKTLNETSLQLSREYGTIFGLKTSKVAYAQNVNSIKEYPFTFAELKDNQHIVSWKNQTFIPLPINDSELFQRDPLEESEPLYDGQADRDGLNISIIKMLVEAAISDDPSDLVVLGGSLPESNWAHANIASQSFRYIKEHPWIHVLDFYSINTFPRVTAIENPLLCQDLICDIASDHGSGNGDNKQPDNSDNNLLYIKEHLKQQILNIQENDLSQQAILTYLYLTQSDSNQDSSQLTAQNLSEIYYMIHASYWSRQPGQIADCNIDVDLDQQNECILANDHIFTIIEMDGARLAYAAGLSGESIVQWIAPSSFYVTGQSATDNWIIQNGKIYEPAGIYGAFVEKSNSFVEFHPQIISNAGIELTNSDYSIQKSYRINEDYLDVLYTADQPIQTDIFLAIDPQRRFSPDWKENYLNQIHIDSQQIQWGTSNQQFLSLEIVNGSYHINTFLDSYAWIGEPEDPDRYYLDGHFLPFSTALISIDSTDSFHVKISQNKSKLE